MSARFNIKAAEPEAVASLQRELHMPHFIAATLVSRGIDTPEAANRFLTPSLDRDWRDPYIIPGLSEAADALEAAIRRGDHILVFGDFDLDGISATTVMTVSFVNAGLLTLAQAISVIMGANIGTTLTAWIMSLGFNVDLTMVVFPAFFIGIMLIYSKRRRFIGDFLFGIAFLFFALVLLSAAGKELDLEHNPDAIHFFSSFDTHSHFNIVVFVLIGTLITCIVQSSAAVMAITILLCSTGVLPIYFGIALVLGENIGTTATANLAALGANTQARRAALAHLVFNVFGVVWVLCLFYPFVDAVCSLVGYDPTGAGTSQTQKAVLLPIVLAAFHTCFNVTNTFLLIWFIPQIERIRLSDHQAEGQARRGGLPPALHPGWHHENPRICRTGSLQGDSLLLWAHP